MFWLISIFFLPSLGFAFAVAAIDVIKVNFAPPVVSAI